jgi:hypothetical protein
MYLSIIGEDWHWVQREETADGDFSLSCAVFPQEISISVH